MTRIVLLGASNVTLGFGVISRLLRNGFTGPLDILGALGHGRSYGMWSTMAVRSLPPIVECGLWQTLASRNLPTFALLTDVGNDLMYGHRPETIVGWVATCLDRLSDADAQIIVTRLPIARIERLSALRYHAVRLSFFPFHRPITWRDMLGRARELDARVEEAARQVGATIRTPPLEWYGFDPIHIRWTQRTRAWTDILSPWEGFRLPESRTAVPLSLLGRFPAQYRLLGRSITARQPASASPDSMLSLY